MDKQFLLRRIPQLDALLSEDLFCFLIDKYGAGPVREAARALLASKRQSILDHEETVPETINLEITDLARETESLIEVDRRHDLQPVLNATGIILHTNLGRAPLSNSAITAIIETSHGYNNLEFDLEIGSRGNRCDNVSYLLNKLTGAEESLVVNNNAGALLLLLDTLAKGKEVIVSRGELVEIGGSFRIPEIMTQSGALLKEVGTTNRTRLSDYAGAVTENTAALLKVHRSNFRIEGFTSEVGLAELSDLAKETGLPLIYDLGSGLLHPQPPAILAAEPQLTPSVLGLVDAVCFSGDKLLGGPQAGIILSRSDIVQKLRKNPLLRVLRVDKLVLAALTSTLRSYQDPDSLSEDIPFYRLLTVSENKIKKRAQNLLDLLLSKNVKAQLIPCCGEIGAGSAPGVTLASWAVAIPAESTVCSLTDIEQRLRLGSPPVVAYINDGKLIFDLRCIDDDDLYVLAEAIKIASLNVMK